MAGKKKTEPPVTLEALRDACVAIAFSVKRGEMTATSANAMTNALRSAIYAEQLRLNRDRGTESLSLENEGNIMELSQDTKDKLDEIAKLMVSKKGGKNDL